MISPSGARIAFGVNEEDGTRTVYVAAPGGEPEKVCEGCTRATDWSSYKKGPLDLRRRSLSGQSSRRGYSSADAVAEACHVSFVVWSLLARQPLGQLHGSDFTDSRARGHRALRWAAAYFPKRLDHDRGRMD